MSGGLFARLKTWVQDEKLKYNDLNAEFDNIINNSAATKVSGYSDTLAQMQATENPGTSGSELTGTSISTADEIERLRFKLMQILGSTYWYDAPATDLTTLNASITSSAGQPQSRFIGGRTSEYLQPLHLVPSGAGATASLKVTATLPTIAGNFEYYINGIRHTITADTTVSSLQAGSGTFGVSIYTMLPQHSEVVLTSALSTTTGKMYCFKISSTGGTEYALGILDTTTLITSLVRGTFFGSTDANFPVIAYHASPTFTVMGTNWVFAKSDGTLDSCYNNPFITGTAPASAASGDYWYDTYNKKWFKYSGSAWADSLAVLVGVVGCDATNAVCAMSFAPYKNYSAENTVVPKINLEGSDQIIRSRDEGFSLNVYGNRVSSPVGGITFGKAPGTSGGSVLYVDVSGTPRLSAVAPIKRTDLGGWYYPSRPWRAIGYATYTATQWDAPYGEDIFSNTSIRCAASTISYGYLSQSANVSAQAVGNTWVTVVDTALDTVGGLCAINVSGSITTFASRTIPTSAVFIYECDVQLVVDGSAIAGNAGSTFIGFGVASSAAGQTALSVGVIAALQPGVRHIQAQVRSRQMYAPTEGDFTNIVSNTFDSTLQITAGTLYDQFRGNRN